MNKGNFRNDNVDVIYSLITNFISIKSCYDVEKKKDRNKQPIRTHLSYVIYFQLILKAVPQTNQDLYEVLYKFDAKSELEEYSLPSVTNVQKKPDVKQKSMVGFKDESQLSKTKFNEKAKTQEVPFEEQEEQVNQEQNQGGASYSEIVHNLFNKKEKKQVNKIQNADFVNAEVRRYERNIKTGEDAISFFAKYGNTTPIKFINCVRAEAKNLTDFRPYDLISISLSENQKELTLLEYYTISANGIVHVWTDKGKRLSGQGETSTEVISLSDWMHESTMFNIITNIQFFKNYAITKIFNLWKANVHYRIFCKTRMRLIHDSFIAKPAFADHLIKINESMYQLQNVKTISPNITQNKTWEPDDFKADQKKSRATSSQTYEVIIEVVVMECETLVNEVIERTKIKDQTEIEEGRFGQQVKQKPMNEIRRDNEEREYLLDRAQKDKDKLRNFVRLVDYIVEETLYTTNFVSMQALYDEMKKVGRKQALFNTGVNFDQVGMMYNPDEPDVTDMLLSLLDEMVSTVKNTTRVIDKLENYVKMFSTDSKCDLQRMIVESVKFIGLREEIQNKVKQDFDAAQKYVNDNYEKCRDIHNFSNQGNLEEFLQEEQRIEIIKGKIKELKDWNQNIIDYIKDTPKGVLQVDGKKIKLRLEPFVKNCLTKIKEYLYDLMKKKCDILDKQLNGYNAYLSKPPQNLKEYTDYIEYFQKLKEEMGCVGNSEVDIKLLKKKNEIDDMQFQLKQQFETNAVRTEDTFKIDEITNQYQKLFGENGQYNEAKKLVNEKKNEMVLSVEKENEDLKKKIVTTSQLVNSGILVEEGADSKLALEKLMEIENKQISQYIKKEQTLSKYQKLMDLNPQPNKDLNDLKSKFADRQILWKHIDSYATQYEEWYMGDFTKLDCEQIEKEMKQFEGTAIVLKTRISNLLGKDQTKDKVLESHAQNIQKITRIMPVIQALGNKDLRPRHWQLIFQKLEMNIKYGESTFTLKELMKQGVEQKMDEMEEISSKASGEMGIENQLEEIRKKWQELNFEIKTYRDYKDKFIVGSVEDIVAALDDHQLKIQTMLGTRFVQAIRGDVEQWEGKLLLIQETIDEWLMCQKSWMYLENIFSAEDIQKQLPQETTKFQAVDKFWKEQMVKSFKRPLVQDLCNSKDLKNKFEQANFHLDEIQKCLENYLETKRAAFPRFYFLSNDELLEILSQTRNPHAVQGHLRKCFDNIASISFTTDEDSKEIIGMTSAEPEQQPENVKFSQSVIAEGPVEHWLLKIQEMMIKSLYDQTKKALLVYPDNILERQEWLFSFPAQPILVVDIVKWTEGCTDAISKANDGNMDAITEYYEQLKSLITAQVNIVRQNLNILQRTLMGALIVIDVHARDVTAQMAAKRINNLNDFEWSKQLRYYWATEEKDGAGDCVVKQTNSFFLYSYEYLGNGPRLVITPLTDKCYITLTSAKHLQYGGAPAGPAGTGKTETTKDLAKALAVQCVVFNCSDGLDVKTMGRFFAGLAQCGAWACFDEFNRIDIEVLSVIAQQVLSIQANIRDKKDLMIFEGREMPLVARFGVFITMNPGYAGRTELPDNLKALFRPVAMMIPDYALIAEIILFSEGFGMAQILARKMTKLYSLSSEQLSKQDHYDFGMRAVKSVLVMAGALRRKDPEVSEDVVLIRAMRDSNVPKFLSHDLPLFFGIIDDLFPGVPVPFIDYGNVKKSIENQLELMHYLKPEKFVNKIIQLLETVMVRHGVMVVGVASTGKTTVISTLARALGQLNKEGSTDFWHKPVKMEKLNPKSVTLNELFGYTNITTNEWTDGIAAKIIRENVKEVTETKKWIVFDGPVDAIWIENMNTVLDDNRMLCLNNGQRIKLPVTFEMVFEVNDLSAASPATVSRCGMVYMEPLHLGWEPQIDTWGYYFKEQNKDKEEKVPGYINGMLERIKIFFTEYFKEIREKVKEVIPSVDANLIKSCLNLINVCWEECKTVHNNFIALQPNEIDNLASMVFIFAFIWSAGGNLQDNVKENSRVHFSNQIRSKIMKIYQGFPYENEVYDYYPNYEEKSFKPWTELIKEFKYNKEQPYFNILVPTTDTTKYTYLMQKLVLNANNMLLMGETGVGKSVIVNDFIMSLDQEKYVFVSLNFSAQTAPKNLTDLFMDKDKFPRKRKDLIGPPAGRKMIIFIDDINMPAVEQYGAQPVNELLRQIIDSGGFYDLKKLFFITMKDLVFVSACASPGGGRNHVTPRLFRHFNMIWAPDLTQRSMETIFIQILKGFLGESNNKGNEKFAPSIVKSTVDIYNKITKELLPTPKKSHYTFNLRDISKIFQGVLMVQYEYIKEKSDLIALWTHECLRIFSDRLVDDDDRNWFFSQIGEHLKKTFEFEWPQEEFSNFLYGDYANSNKDYCKVENQDVLPNKFNDYMMIYNSVVPKTMNLVFFYDAIKHLSRLLRTLRQNRGNSLLIGVGGSGRQSLTRMATHIRGYTCFGIEIMKNYKEPQWKDDLKKLLKSAGAKNQEVVFLFSDTQIVRESFLEDINNLLNIGEVPNLWVVEDYEEILGDIRHIAKENKIEDTRESLLKFFVQLVRENLHIVLAFSPVGEKLRNRCRMFPSMVNCCAIDWFDKWPDQALFSVANKEYRLHDKLGLLPFAEKLSNISVKIHKDVIDKSEVFYDELKRRNYVTPTSYLELLKLYIDLMKYKQGILPAQISKYSVGLETLKETNIEVAKLQKQIIEFKPKLEVMSIENAKMVIELEGKTKIANETAVICQKEANETQIIRDEVNEQRSSCQKDLDEAMPILRKAQDAVKKIDKNSITDMKSMKNPPALVRLVMESACLLFGEKEDWATAQKLLGQMNFREQLLDFNVDSVENKRWVKFKNTYLVNPDYTEEKIKTVSTASLAILTWASASEKFYQVKKVVGPKQKKLAEAEEKLKEVESTLAKKEAALKEVQDMVAELQRNLDGSTRKAQQLKGQQEDAEVKLRRAEKLLGGLSGEAIRWKESEIKLGIDLVNLTGNILISSACISYLGPFTYAYRQELVEEWIKECKLQEIPVSDDYNIGKILCEEVQLREWQEHGLPADNLSIENGIFIFNCRRWPLIIDPQGQANRWIRNIGEEFNISKTKLTEPNFLKTLENAIRFGQQVLLENVEEELDPSLEPILTKQTTKKGAQLFLRLGDQDIPYSNEFRFYMTTKMPNPHYIPEICIKTTIINFTVTPAGLEDQLLVEVVRYERIELEEKRISLILEISQCKRQLQELEDRILRQINEAAGRILEDEEVINTLDASKVTSETVNTRLEQSKITSAEIDSTRELYRPVAKRGSVLYFVIANLSNIDPMYQYSLEFFIMIFKMRLEKAPNPTELQQRLEALVTDITSSFYTNICRGLFEKDKLLYSFTISVNISLESKEINQREWTFFLRGPTGDVPLTEEQTYPAWCNEKILKNIVGLSKESQTFMTYPDVINDPEELATFQKILESKDPWTEKLPAVYEGKINIFQKLLFLKLLREEKLVQLVRNYVGQSLGELFTFSPLFDLKGTFADSTSITPIIFVLSPGADPIAYLFQLAKEKEFGDRLKTLSLGQGQGEIAREFIKSGRRNGDWVCLQNCHLAISWMTEFERIQEMQVEADTHPEYRLWLTSMPSTKFPVPILQSGIKLTNEPPKGLKANILGTVSEFDEKTYNNNQKPREYQRLLFSLAFFHAAILERKKFGAIGWNIQYEWMLSDFQTSQAQLYMYLNEQPDVPYETLSYLIATVNYGGRVTDDKDVYCIAALLIKYFNPQVMKSKYEFAPGGIYTSPEDLSLDAVKDLVRKLPAEDDPEVFGLHPNAQITYQTKIVKQLLDTLILSQPGASGAKGGLKPEDIVSQMANKLIQEMPDKLPAKKLDENSNSLDVFRYQEVSQFNVLIGKIRSSLNDLVKAIQGTVVMSIQLEAMFDAIMFKRVPALWEKVAFPSLKPLASWIPDLQARIEFMREWVNKGQMDSYWISALYFPQGFMTAALQSYSRRTHIAIDTLIFRTQLRQIMSDQAVSPEKGVNVHGLFIEGCRWNMQEGQLEESKPLILFEEIPVIWLEPVLIVDYKAQGYNCPLYKTSTRKGTLSTTGHSTNFVMYMDLKTNKDVTYWIRRGVALLTMLDD